MKVLSGLNFEDIEDYLKYMPEISVLDIANDKKSLIDMISLASYDIVLLSRELPGSEETEYLIEVLSSEEYRSCRIIFIYGEYDEECDDFVRLLINRGIYDFFVGEEITSRDIEMLIFKPAGKEKAFGYYKSRFDNERYFHHKKRGMKRDKRLFNGAALAGHVFLPFFRSTRNKRISFEKLVISIISNQATGKSHTAWNLSCSLSKRGYATSLFNIDRGYSANLFFDIDEVYYDLLDHIIRNNGHKQILESCFKKKNLSIVTGRLGDEKEIGADDFIKLLYSIRTKSDITIIDTRTGLSELTRLSIKSSTYDLLIFDCDIMHFHMNMSMLEELKDDFIPEKTIAVINNTNVKSPGHKFIYNELANTGIHFKDIAFISSCGLLSSEVMHTGLSPYQAAGEANKAFACDVDNLIDKLSSRTGCKGLSRRIFGN